MAQHQIILGKVALLDRGAYDSEATYAKLDMVTTGVSAFYSKQDGNTGNALPTTIAEAEASEWWGYLANGDLAATAAETAETQAAAAEAAAKTANAAATKAATATTTLTNTADEATTKANAAAKTADAAAANAKETADTAAAKAQSLIDAMATQGTIAPTAMSVEYPTEITTANKVKRRIKAVLTPEGVMQNVIFIREEGTSLKADCRGFLTVKGTGTTVFHVIPTMNTGLGQEISINVRAPRIRLTSSGMIRLTSSGTMRI